jgi:alkylation response protein AidB-like acyl-CoA dehydrogenase
MGVTDTVQQPDPLASLDQTAIAFRSWMQLKAEEFEDHRHRLPEDLDITLPRARALQALLWDGGWTRLGWPLELGGLGGTPLQRAVVTEELSVAGYQLPMMHGVMEIIAPMLARFAPELAQRHLAAAGRGDEFWCQGFSEPDAGSDLGSLRTRAVPDGDGYRISGQKMWSSSAHLSHWSALLARTGEAGSGYRGLTLFWVELASPGVRVVPTHCENGRSETSEIFLDDVYVPSSHIIGEVGGGWTPIMYLMQFERGGYAWIRQAELHGRLADVVGAIPAGTPGAAEVVGDAYLSLLGLRARCKSTITTLHSGRDLGPEISVDKLLLGMAEQTVTDAARHLLWPRLEMSEDDETEVWRNDWAYSRVTTVYGGAAEVQRDLVAQRLLGLPRER